MELLGSIILMFIVYVVLALFSCWQHWGNQETIFACVLFFNVEWILFSCSIFTEERPELMHAYTSARWKNTVELL